MFLVSRLRLLIMSNTRPGVPLTTWTPKSNLRISSPMLVPPIQAWHCTFIISPSARTTCTKKSNSANERFLGWVGVGGGGGHHELRQTFDQVEYRNTSPRSLYIWAAVQFYVYIQISIVNKITGKGVLNTRTFASRLSSLIALCPRGAHR